jgi:hypothetical protein
MVIKTWKTDHNLRAALMASRVPLLDYFVSHSFHVVGRSVVIVIISLLRKEHGCAVLSNMWKHAQTGENKSVEDMEKLAIKPVVVKSVVK